MKYITQAITLNRQLLPGPEAELRTLGEAMDSLLAGNLGRVGDLLAQRFRAVDLQSSGEATWEQAKHLEITMPTRASSVPTTMRKEAQKLQKQEVNLTSKLGEGAWGKGKGQWKGVNLWRGAFPYQPKGGKGAWKGDQKGQFKGDFKGKNKTDKGKGKNKGWWDGY